VKTAGIRFAASIVAIAAVSAPALAHVGHTHGVGGHAGIAGFLHPLGSAAHILAMVAVGLWASSFSGSGRWLVIAAFPAAMMAGAAMTVGGLAIPAIETALALSVVATGLLVAQRVKLPAELGAGLIGLLAVAHGGAHGAALTAGTAPMAYAAGFIAATLTLHLGGLALAGLLTRAGDNGMRQVTRTGGAVAAAGAILLVV